MADWPSYAPEIPHHVWVHGWCLSGDRAIGILIHKFLRWQEGIWSTGFSDDGGGGARSASMFLRWERKASERSFCMIGVNLLSHLSYFSNSSPLPLLSNHSNGILSERPSGHVISTRSIRQTAVKRTKPNCNGSKSKPIMGARVLPFNGTQLNNVIRRCRPKKNKATIIICVIIYFFSSWKERRKKNVEPATSKFFFLINELSTDRKKKKKKQLHLKEEEITRNFRKEECALFFFFFATRNEGVYLGEIE